MTSVQPSQEELLALGTACNLDISFNICFKIYLIIRLCVGRQTLNKFRKQKKGQTHHVRATPDAKSIRVYYIIDMYIVYIYNPIT